MEDVGEFSDVRRGRCIVLLDSHRSLGQPICTAKELQDAIFGEVSRELKRSSKVSMGSWLFGPSPPSRADIRAHAGATAKAVLSGERPPPGVLSRAVDVVVRVLASFTESWLGGPNSSDVICILFGDAGDARCLADAMPERIPPARVMAAWAGAGCTLGVPSLAAVCASGEGLLDATTVIILTARALSIEPVSMCSSGGQDQSPSFFWIHCVTEAPPDFWHTSEACTASGGVASIARSTDALHAALWRALGCQGSNVLPFASKCQSPALATSAALGLAAPRGPLVGREPQACERDPGALSEPSVAQAVLERAVGLSKLSSTERRARIHDLVAQELLWRQETTKAIAPVAGINRALNARRSVEQRLLLQWLLVLSRILAFCGDVLSLARSGCVSLLWKESLQFNGTDLSCRLWKWVVRFGEPLPRTCRWGFWCWLHSRRAPLVALSGCARDFPKRLECGRRDEALVDARTSIAADVPRTFSGIGAKTCGSSLLPEDCDRNPGGLTERGSALERILLAVAADCPSLGYCQGLHILVAFVLSVVEEAGIVGATAEAEVFAFVGRLFGLYGIRSWMEPPLVGLRAAVGALGVLLRERLPRLVEHLESEGAAVELLSLSWFQTLFTGLTPLPRAALCRIWECWLFDGSPKVFFRVALALFAHAEETLLGEPLEEVANTLKNFQPPLRLGLNAAELMTKAWAIKVTDSALRCVLASAEASVRQADFAACSRSLQEVTASVDRSPKADTQDCHGLHPTDLLG